MVAAAAYNGLRLAGAGTGLAARRAPVFADTCIAIGTYILAVT
jgi:hypothetical protein